MPIIVLFTNFCDAATSPCNATTTKPHVSTEQNWCPWRESDPRPLPYQGSALPLSHMGVMPFVIVGAGDEVRTRDILLGRQVLYQLSYTRTMQNTQGRLSPFHFTHRPQAINFGGGGWIRTSVLRENGFTVRRL